MAHSRGKRPFLALAVVVCALLALVLPASADSSWVDEFGPGIACEGFGVRVETVYSHEVVRELKGKDGSTRAVFIGNSDITLTNLSTGKTVSVKLGGSVFHDTYYPDGSMTSANTGNVLVILFPTDVFDGGAQAGPSTATYSGRFVYEADPDYNWTVQRINGRSTDLCAQLAG